MKIKNLICIYKYNLHLILINYFFTDAFQLYIFLIIVYDVNFLFLLVFFYFMQKVDIKIQFYKNKNED